MTGAGTGTLDGRRWLVLVPEGRGGRLAELLAGCGARVIVDSVTRTEALAPEELHVVDAWLAGREVADWLVLSSAEGVRRLVERANALSADLSARWAFPCRVAAIGPATGQLLIEFGRTPDLVADDPRSEGLAEALIQARPGGVSGQSVLVVRALEGRPELAETLTAAGARLQLAPIYRTVMIPGAAERVAVRLGSDTPEFDLLIVTSGAPIRLLAGAMPLRKRGQVSVAAFGPVTAGVASELGFSVVVTGHGGSLEQLAHAIFDHETTR